MPVTGVRFVPNPAGILALGKSAGIGLAMMKIGELIAQAAEESAPVDTGDYAAGIEAELDHNDAGLAICRVRATDWKSGLIEFASTSPAPGNLRNAAESITGDLSGAEE